MKKTVSERRYYFFSLTTIAEIRDTIIPTGKGSIRNVHPNTERGVLYICLNCCICVATTPEGYTPGFLRDIKPYLRELMDRKIKLVTNWGGLDPEGAAAALRALGP